MDTVDDLEIAREEALGTLLGMVDWAVLQLEHPNIVEILRALHRLRDARDVHTKAFKAELDARLPK